MSTVTTQFVPLQTPSRYQQAVYDFVLHGQGNAVISAVAGSGKTTTVLNCIRMISLDKNVMYLAFNRDIVQETSEKITQDNLTIKTLHGYGMSACTKNLPDLGKNAVDEKKYNKILKAIYSFIQVGDLDIIAPLELNDEQVEKLRLFEYTGEPETFDSYNDRIIRLTHLGRVNLVNTVEQLEDLAEKHNVNLTNGECLRALNLIEIGARYTKSIDYTDMIYLPVKWNMPVFQFDFVFVDECQDLSAAQRTLMLKAIKKNGRFIAVGDPHQCQPAGTLVSLSNGEVKRIEDIKVGDRVVSYDGRGMGGFSGWNPTNKHSVEKAPAILKKASRKYKGTLIEIFSNGKTSQYTPEHKCIFRFNEDTRGKYITYLMQKGDFFRLGVTQFWNGSKSFGLAERMRHEKADNGWLLLVGTKEECLTLEYSLSVLYGIPQLMFEKRKFNSSLFDNKIKIAYDSATTLIKENATNLLYEYSLDIKLPLFSRNTGMRFSTEGCSETYAINLIAEYMEVNHFDYSKLNIRRKSVKNTRCIATWQAIERINYRFYDGLVYSLQVDKYETYVADGIVTHNCIYGFAGADITSYNKLVALPNTVELPLSVSYRCGSAIVAKAQTIVPHIEAAPNAKEGVVDLEASKNNIQDGDMVLCRVTYPLVKLCFYFLKQGIKATIKGKDVGAQLQTMIRNTKVTTLDKMFDKLYHELELVKRRIMRKDNCTEQEAEEHQTYVNLVEKIEIIEFLATGATEIQEIVDKLEIIFSDTEKKGIILSTIHKSKGLEANRVYIIHPEKMPSPYARQDWEKVQEENLRYVAYTRAKHYLGEVIDFDAYAESESQAGNVKEVTESMFVGTIGEKHPCELTITSVMSIPTTYGDTMLYKLVDHSGNVFSKFGVIDVKHIVNGFDDVVVGARIRVKATIKEHKTYKGVNETVISHLAKFK